LAALSGFGWWFWAGSEWVKAYGVVPCIGGLLDWGVDGLPRERRRAATCTYTYRYGTLCHRAGDRCRHPALPSSSYCMWHQPEDGKDLRGLDLSQAEVQARHLCEAHLAKAHLDYANLQRADLIGANLQRAVLWGANLQGAVLWGANLQEAHLGGANLQEAHLGEANLQEAVLRGANLQRADLWRANLQEAHLGEANLQGANLWKAKLQGANLREAKLQGANLRGSNLQEAVLEFARLGRADLRGAGLECARLVRADLREAMLDGARLVYTDLRGADLQMANLDGAQVKWVYLAGRVGMARLQLSTLKAAESLDNLVATPQLAHKRFRRSYPEWGSGRVEDYRVVPRDVHDVARDHRLLKIYFKQEGRPDLASRHYLEEMRWMRRHYRETGQWGRLVGSILYWGLCGYGERPLLVVGWSVVSVFICWLILVAKDVAAWGVGVLPGVVLGYGLVSGLAFAAGPPLELLEASGVSGVLVAMVEALVGKFLMALFVFTLGRKVER